MTKTKVNKLNSFSVNWQYRLSIGIRLFFKFNIIATKEYYLTIISSLEVSHEITYKYTTSGSTCSIIKI